MMDKQGWIVERQRKMYGPYVEVTVEGDLMTIVVKTNPLGLQVAPGPLLGVPATRLNADRIGWQVSALIDTCVALATEVEVPVDLYDLNLPVPVAE